ncbi:DUF6602 domain-containing protein [Gordonia sp. CPCC 205515]|uniref:DUF6602 domain-containing protein n=1 Tax=Gordonia sp. CPCC 205515 TaxID=3140791 RepID=UPI003AF34853
MTTDQSSPRFDLRNAFLNKQRALEASYLAIRSVTTHPGTKGDEFEADWIGLIRDFLPRRYEVGPIFAVDHTGAMSDQIDVAVYDSHYSPQWFGAANGTRFVPVESVYAAFEVKPEFNADYVRYTMDKIASVRQLKRTSAPVIHKGGRYPKSEIAVEPIIGGLLAMRSSWADFVTTFDTYQPTSRSDDRFLNIGIAADSLCFDYTPSLDPDGDLNVEQTVSQPGQALIHFAIRLFRQLQAIGTVPAIDMQCYEKRLVGSVPET